jgi:hypothetical protein
MAVRDTERISTAWQRFRRRFRSKTLPLLVFAAVTVLTFLMWTRQREMPPGASRPGYGIFSGQASRH